jgi:hypothetical protein
LAGLLATGLVWSGLQAASRQQGGSLLPWLACLSAACLLASREEKERKKEREKEQMRGASEEVG